MIEPNSRLAKMPGIYPKSSFRQGFAQQFTGKLAKASGLMFFATVGGGVLGYVFQIFMGRMLSVVDYGLFIAMMTLLVLVSVPLTTLTMLVSRRVSEYRVKQQKSKVAAIFRWVNTTVSWCAFAMLLVTLPLSPYIKDYANLDSLIPVWVFLLAAVAMLFGAVNIAFLQALQKFDFIALASIGLHAFKILFCVAFVLAGMKLLGALIGLLLASVAIWLMTYLPLRADVARSVAKNGSDNYFSLRMAAPVFIANLTFALITQVDLLLVKHYFDPQMAGIYAAAAILGKAVMYLPGAIIIALFPMVAENESEAKSSAHLFINAIVLAVGFSGVGALIYYFFCDEIIELLYGHKYPGAANILKYYGFAMLPMSIIMVTEHFLIAKGRVVFSYLMVIAIPFLLYAAHVFNEKLINMVYILSTAGWGLVIAGFAMIGHQLFDAKREERPSN